VSLRAARRAGTSGGAANLAPVEGAALTLDNIAGFMAMPEIDGALVGGASLKPDFVELVRRAVRAAGRPR